MSANQPEGTTPKRFIAYEPIASDDPSAPYYKVAREAMFYSDHCEIVDALRHQLEETQARLTECKDHQEAILSTYRQVRAALGGEPGVDAFLLAQKLKADNEALRIYDAPDLEAAIDAGARNAYAKCHSTNGPYTLESYASEQIMRGQHRMARYVVEGFLAHLAKDIVTPNA